MIYKCSVTYDSDGLRTVFSPNLGALAVRACLTRPNVAVRHPSRVAAPISASLDSAAASPKPSIF